MYVLRWMNVYVRLDFTPFHVFFRAPQYVRPSHVRVESSLSKRIRVEVEAELDRTTFPLGTCAECEIFVISYKVRRLESERRPCGVCSTSTTISGIIFIVEGILWGTEVKVIQSCRVGNILVKLGELLFRFCCRLRKTLPCSSVFADSYKRYGILLVPGMNYRFVGSLMIGYTLRGFEKFMAVWYIKSEVTR